MTSIPSQGQKFRDAVAAEKPLQVIGAINAYHARLAEQSGYKAIYLSGGGVAAGRESTDEFFKSKKKKQAEAAAQVLASLRMRIDEIEKERSQS